MLVCVFLNMHCNRVCVNVFAIHGLTRVSAGKERRSVDYVDKLPDPDNPLPVEWYSWLHNVRKDVPTPQLSASLAREREERRRNAQQWDDEQNRKEMQAQLSMEQEEREHQAALNPHANTMFDQAMALSEAVSNTFNSGNNENLSVKIVQQSSHSYDTVTASSHRKPPLSQDKHQLQQPKVTVDQTTYKAPNLSDTSSNKHRDILKAYASTRTSPFLGVKPQIRADSHQKATEHQESSAETQESQSSESLSAEDLDALQELIQQQQRAPPSVQQMDPIDSYEKHMEKKRKRLLEEQQKQ
mgnify:CR=1 FL=1